MIWCRPIRFVIRPLWNLKRNKGFDWGNIDLWLYTTVFQTVHWFYQYMEAFWYGQRVSLPMYVPLIMFLRFSSRRDRLFLMVLLQRGGRVDGVPKRGRRHGCDSVCSQHCRAVRGGQYVFRFDLVSRCILIYCRFIFFLEMIHICARTASILSPHP